MGMKTIAYIALSLVLWPFIVIVVALGVVVFAIGWPAIGTYTMKEELE